MLIAIEGLDATGKKTQSDLLLSHLLRITDELCVVQSFPDYSTSTGNAILGLLKDDWWPSFATMEQARQHTELRALILQSLMTQNRYEKYDLLMKYAQSAKSHMVCDRYYASGLVYGQSDGIDLDYLLRVHSALPAADLWILVDISPEESVKRRPIRRDEYEKRAGFLDIVRDKYLKLFNNPPTPGKWVIVDGMPSTEAVHDSIVNIVSDFLGGQS